MLKQIVLFALAIASVSANLTFTDCGSQSQVLAFRLRGCEQTPCLFIRGNDYYGEMDVIAAASTPILPFVIQAILGVIIPPPITIFEGDACDDLVEGYCPTEVGEAITARLYMDIPTILPAISTNVRATVRDHLNQIQVCVQIPVQIV